MKRILTSLMIIVAMVAMVSTATLAYFNDPAVLGDSTFATGILDIKVNGQDNSAGFNVTAQYPGGPVASKEFSLQNYGAPYFAGPSTLTAYGLTAKSVFKGGDGSLFNNLQAKLFVNAGWGGCSNGSVTFVAGKGCTAYAGNLNAMTSADILAATQWGTHATLIPGNSFTMLLEVYLPETHVNQNSLMGKSTTFDVVFDGYTSWPL